MPGSRFLEVAPGRLQGWVERYVAARGGDVTLRTTVTGVLLHGGDGSSAALDLLVPGAAWPPPGQLADEPWRADADAGELLAAAAAAPLTLLVLLARRGGWAVGVVRDGAVAQGKVGRRYVQGQTAAGGWSQQRYARRRSGQSAKLADDASTAVATVLDRAVPLTPVAVVVGGDRSLAAHVLDGGALADLPRHGPLDVGEPRRTDLDAAAARVLAVRVTVHDAP